MRIKIIGDNNCARATRHLLRMAGFAVTDFLPSEAIVQAPHYGYAITIELSPATHTPPTEVPSSTGTSAGLPTFTPDDPTHGPPTPRNEEASTLANAVADASLPSALPGQVEPGERNGGTMNGTKSGTMSGPAIHFDSVESAIESAVLRHVAKLSATPVVVDRQGGMVRSERELRIVVPQTGDAKADEAAAVAVEFGVLRGLLDIVSPGTPLVRASKSAADAGEPQRARQKKWWAFGIVVVVGALLTPAGSPPKASPFRLPVRENPLSFLHAVEARGTNGAYLRLAASLAPAPAQGEFATGQQTKLTDGTNTLVIDPCKGQAKNYVSINQTANTQLAAGTSSKKIYICSIHVVVASATNVALVEGSGTVCATGTAGVAGFGGATAATGWNFGANGGMVLGNGDVAIGAEGTSGDNLCLYNSSAGQVSGGVSYVVQ